MFHMNHLYSILVYPSLGLHVGFFDIIGIIHNSSFFCGKTFSLAYHEPEEGDVDRVDRNLDGIVSPADGAEGDRVGKLVKGLRAVLG